MYISSLGLHITDQCNSSCQHCAYHCGPDIKGVMNFGDAKRYLYQSVKQSVEIICISGGEPCLFFDLVTSIIRKAKALNFSNIWLFTNVFWAKNPNITNNKLKQLKVAGLTKLCLSADGFHHAFVPTSKIQYALTSARNLGLEIMLDVRFLGSPQDNNMLNKLTYQILEQLGNLDDVEVIQGIPLYIGRGAEKLLSYIPKIPGIPKGSCSGPWVGGTWENPSGIDVDLYGEVTLCPGISIGNTKKHSLYNILNYYNPQAHPIINKLMVDGPKSLVKMAQQKGYLLQVGYISKCHLCYDIRKFLHSLYPLELAPKICYWNGNK